MNKLAVFLACLAGVIFYIAYIPLTTDFSVNHGMLALNENPTYFESNKFEILFGLGASLFGSISAYITRVSFPYLALSLFITSLISPLRTFFTEANNSLFTNILELATPFLLISFVIVGFLFVINLKFKRI